MIVTMDRSGRLVIPAAIRRAARLEPGQPLEIRVWDGRVEIEPAPRAVRVRERGGIFVAEPVDPSAELRSEDVRRTIDDVRSGPAD